MSGIIWIIVGAFIGGAIIGASFQPHWPLTEPQIIIGAFGSVCMILGGLAQLVADYLRK